VEAVAAIVVLRPNEAVEETSLIDYARGELAPFKVPKRIFFAESIPRNTAGKVLKRVLRDEYANALNDAP
jgi:fatty-acyl-CoA synthase